MRVSSTPDTRALVIVGTTGHRRTEPMDKRRTLGSRAFNLGAGGGGVNRAPQNWGRGVWEKGSINRTTNQLL